jgi:hypothetical protein
MLSPLLTADCVNEGGLETCAGLRTEQILCVQQPENYNDMPVLEIRKLLLTVCALTTSRAEAALPFDALLMSP